MPPGGHSKKTIKEKNHRGQYNDNDMTVEAAAHDDNYGAAKKRDNAKLLSYRAQARFSKFLSRDFAYYCLGWGILH